MKHFNLFIAMPSTHTVESKFMMSMILLTNYLSSHPLPGVQEMSYRVNSKTGSSLPNMRQSMIYQALEEGATHLLFVDSDQTFPRDTVHLMMRHRKHVVAANIVTKKLEDCNPTARQYNPDNPAGDLVFTHYNSTGLEEVWRVGTGIMLIDMNVFKRDNLGYDDLFPHIWQPKLRSYCGEDWGFCQRLQNAGVKIYIDHDVSKQVGHIGPVNFMHDMIAARTYYDELEVKQKQATAK